MYSKSTIMNKKSVYHKIFIRSFIPLAHAEHVDSLPFSGASSIPLCYISFPSTLFHQLVFHPTSLHLAIYSWSTSQHCCFKTHI